MITPGQALLLPSPPVRWLFRSFPHFLRPDLRGVRLVQIVVLGVLCTLQGQLEREALFRDLVDPHARRHRGGARVSSARLTRFGRGIGLRLARPAGIDELCQCRLILKNKYHAIIFHPDSEAGACRDHLHEGILLGLRADGYARAARRAEQQQVRSHVVENSVSRRLLDSGLRCRLKLI